MVKDPREHMMFHAYLKRRLKVRKEPVGEVLRLPVSPHRMLMLCEAGRADSTSLSEAYLAADGSSGAGFG